jgi:hypothetical protein
MMLILAKCLNFMLQLCGASMITQLCGTKICGLLFCYILATHARKVFYLPDTRFGKDWQVVQTFYHRHLYKVSQSESVSASAYREDDCCEEEGMRTTVSDDIDDRL